MKSRVHFKSSDWSATFWIASVQAATAWVMTFLDVVYAPIPMFAAALAAGFFFRGRPREASLAGALAGLTGGGLAEWAFHAVRVQNRLLNWGQMPGNEQMGLAIAEMFLYASLLSFFAAFFGWSTGKEPSLAAPAETGGAARGSREVKDLPLMSEKPPSQQPPKN
ncbi:MAG: hypothetical protein AB1439_04670 [candidate division FCPU426 bacterium]